MAKSSSSKPAKSGAKNTPFLSLQALIALAVGVLMLIGAVVILSGSNTASDATGSAVSLIAPAEYQAQFVASNANHFLLDVRTPEEFNGGHIPGAANISVETLSRRLSDVPRDQPVVVYCRSGNRSATAAQILREAGFSEIYDLGGIIAWSAAGLPIE